MCSFKVNVKYDMNGHITSDSDYRSRDAAHEAMGQHSVEAFHGSYGEYEEEYGSATTTRKAKVCKYCGKEKP